MFVMFEYIALKLVDLLHARIISFEMLLSYNRPIYGASL